MLRVTPIQNGSKTTLKLEGNLSGPWVAELENCWAKIVEEKAPVEIDLGGLSFVDPNGTALLVRIQRAGSRLFGGSRFIHDLLSAKANVLRAWRTNLKQREN
jgi:ABC-type transporter Mla MlaB component